MLLVQYPKCQLGCSLIWKLNWRESASKLTYMLIDRPQVLCGYSLWTLLFAIWASPWGCTYIEVCLSKNEKFRRDRERNPFRLYKRSHSLLYNLIRELTFKKLSLIYYVWRRNAILGSKLKTGMTFIQSYVVLPLTFIFFSSKQIFCLLFSVIFITSAIFYLLEMNY